VSIRVANEVRGTGTPVYCSACFNQDPSKDHIDFDAAIDRGYGDDVTQQVAMDDLILCDECVRRGAVLVGMMDAREFQTELDSLRKRYEHEKARADSADDYATKLELALDSRPIAVSTPRRRGRPPKEDQ
jgi:hypothetical protein